MRAWATIYVAQYVGAEKATGFDHIVYGWVFFAIVIAILLGAAWRFVEREPEEYGWPRGQIESWGWVRHLETHSFAPRSAALAIIGIAGVAALSLLL